MIGNILIALGALIPLIGFIDVWLRADQQQTLRDWVEGKWIKCDSMSRHQFALYPLQLFAATLDRVLGTNWSWRAFKRGFVIFFLFLTFLFCVVSIFRLQPSPEMLYSASSNIATKTLENLQKNMSEASQDVANEVRGVYQGLEFLAAHDTPAYRRVYSVFFFLATVLIGAVLGSISTIMCRQHLRELNESAGILTLVAGFVLNLFLFMLLSSFFISAIVIVSMPATWPFLPFIGVFIRLAGLWTIPAMVIASILVCAIGPIWVRIVVVTTMLPTLVMLLSLGLSSILYPYRDGMHKFVSAFLLRMCESKRDPLVFARGLLAFVLCVVGLAAKFFSL